LPQRCTSIKVMLQGADDSRRSRLELLTLAFVHGVVIDRQHAVRHGLR
jgi:hypothetical protein